jgi:tetratricopeptide (TPR) repeat protein
MLNGFTMSSKANEMIEKNKDYDKAMSLLKQSNIECDRQVFVEAHSIWNDLAKCSPNNPDAMLIRGFLIEPLEHDLPKAISFAEYSVRLFPCDAHLRKFLASVYRLSAQHDKALGEIERAIELEPSHPRWFFLKAACMHYTRSVLIDGNYDKAIECYQKYLDSNPSDDSKVPTAFYAIAHLYSMKGEKDNVDKVCSYWERGVEAEKNQLECFEMLGMGKVSYECKKPVGDYLKGLLMMCGGCERLKPKFKCACMKVAYCDRSCQRANWKVHKKICKAKNC